MDKKFTIEEQYQIFLERMGMSEDKMHPTQKLQLRQTFLVLAHNTDKQ